MIAAFVNSCPMAARSRFAAASSMTLRFRQHGTQVWLWIDEELMLFSGDPLPDVHRRSLAIEPMTCPPNAFRTWDALIRFIVHGASLAGARSANAKVSVRWFRSRTAPIRIRFVGRGCATLNAPAGAGRVRPDRGSIEPADDPEAPRFRPR